MDSSALILLGLIFLIPESPRWLMAQKREEEAAKILAKVRGGGNQAVRIFHPSLYLSQALPHSLKMLALDRWASVLRPILFPNQSSFLHILSDAGWKFCAHSLPGHSRACRNQGRAR